MNEIPKLPKKKIREWEKKHILIGVLGGATTMLWMILANYWLGN